MSRVVIAKIIFATLTAGSFFTAFYLYLTVASVGPPEPDAANGVIAQFNDHGHIHYMTRSEWLWMVGSFVASVLFATCYAVVRRTERRRS